MTGSSLYAWALFGMFVACGVGIVCLAVGISLAIEGVRMLFGSED